MVEAILDDAKSKNYNYASQDLALCTILSTEILDWKNHETHDEYLKKMEIIHKRKISFWPQYNASLQKQIKKKASEK